MPTMTSHQTSRKHASPLHTYHSNVMQAMCTQMVSQRDRARDHPLPLAKRPATSSSSRQSGLHQHVQEEMARRVKADRVLQDLSSDKSRQQARARETARRNKWAKSIATACPPSDIARVKRDLGLGGATSNAVDVVAIGVVA